MTFAGNYLAGTQCPPHHASRSASSPLLQLPPRPWIRNWCCPTQSWSPSAPRVLVLPIYLELLSNPIESSEIWKILQSWQMMGVWLNFFLHACQRRHPDLLTFVGNISYPYQWVLVTFCKYHRIALSSVTMTCTPFFTCVIHFMWLRYICYVSFQSRKSKTKTRWTKVLTSKLTRKAWHNFDLEEIMALLAKSTFTIITHT